MFMTRFPAFVFGTSTCLKMTSSPLPNLSQRMNLIPSVKPQYDSGGFVGTTNRIKEAFASRKCDTVVPFFMDAFGCQGQVSPGWGWQTTANK